METKLTPIPGFKDHSNCQGHANWMLDCTFTEQEERDVLIKSIENYLPKEE